MISSRMVHLASTILNQGRHEEVEEMAVSDGDEKEVTRQKSIIHISLHGLCKSNIEYSRSE